MYKKLVLGIDQSYTKTGISIAIDGKLYKVTSTNFKGCKTKSDKRKLLKGIISKILTLNQSKASEVVIICERIRTFSTFNKGKKKGKEDNQQFMNINYIKATGALIASIVDIAAEFNVKVYSVDTRSWKAQVVGNIKKIAGNKKLATVKHVKKLGFDVSYTKRNGETAYDDDAADSACIALYGFCGKQTLKLEE